MRVAAIRLLTAGVVALSLAQNSSATGAAEDNAARDFTTVDDISELEGVWRSRGYGWLVEFSDGEARLYDESDSLCVLKDAQPDEEDLRGHVHISSDGERLQLPINDPSYLHDFDRIAALPEACDDEPDASPEAVLDAMIEAFSEHYAFFEERGVEWPALAEASRRQLHAGAGEDELLSVMDNLVAKVDDAHVSLVAVSHGHEVEEDPGAGRTLSRLEQQAVEEGIPVDRMHRLWERNYWRRDIAQVLLDGEGVQAGNNLISYGLIDGTIGYLAVLAMADFSQDDDGAEADIEALDEAMEEAMELFSEADAVIVDLSINYGGYDTVARALAGRFAAERTIGYYKYAGDAEGAAPQAIHVEPSEGRRYTGPVYLVTSNVTLSAAEILTMSMRALPNVTHIGETTRGALSDILTKPLPNGWEVNLSNEVYLDAEGNVWEGHGIPPEEELPIFSDEDVNEGHLQAIQAIIERIRREG